MWLVYCLEVLIFGCLMLSMIDHPPFGGSGDREDEP